MEEERLHKRTEVRKVLDVKRLLLSVSAGKYRERQKAAEA